MILTIHQPEFMPWLGLLNKILNSDLWVILDESPYKHQYFENRNLIANANGVFWIRVPVFYSFSEKKKISEIEISNRNDWKNKMLKSISQSYAYTDFFNKFYVKIKDIIMDNKNNLCQLNIDLLIFFLECFDIKTKIVLSSDLNFKTKKVDLIKDIVKYFKPSIYLSGASGVCGSRDYDNYFDSINTKIVYQNFEHPVYFQKNHKKSFLPNLSCIDLLFNYGVSGKQLIKKGFIITE